MNAVPAPFGLGVDERIKTVQYYPWRRNLNIETDSGEWFSIDIGSRRNPAPRRTRPIIYLDQNQWSTLSKTLHAPHRIESPVERAAALKLIQLAGQGKVLLPYSAAHLQETAAWSNQTGRSELALTILSSSNGWQMRDPLTVRSAEFEQAIATHAGIPRHVAADVFTLEPYAALDASIEEKTLPADLPVRWEYPYRATLATTVTVACMLDQETVPRGDLSGWVERVDRFARWMANEQHRTTLQKRRSAQVFMLSDSSKEIATAAAAIGATPEQMSAWTHSSWDSPAIGGPAISMFRSAMVDKLLAGGRWEPNDLTDLMYLCTAAAYADHVVGERSAIGLMSQSVRRLHSKVMLHRKIASVVDALAKQGISPDLPGLPRL